MGREARANKSAQFAAAHSFKKPERPVRRRILVQRKKEDIVDMLLAARGPKHKHMRSILKDSLNQKRS